MHLLLRRSLIVALCVLLLLHPPRARAQSLHAIAVEVVVGIIGVTALITVGIVLAVKHHPSLKGCAAGGPDGLTLTDADGKHFLLVGDIAELKSGDRVKVSGKKTKKSDTTQKFIVEKAKDYGPCPAAATP
jgi:hypothetical protein